MKRRMAVLFAAIMLLALSASAEEINTPYDALAALMNGKTYTLSMHAENVEGLEDELSPYGAVRCMLKEEGETIVLSISCEGEAYISARAEASGYEVETNLLEDGKRSGTWAELDAHTVWTENADSRELTVRLSGPDHALITFMFSINGTEVTEYTVDLGLTILNADGTFYNFFDTISASGGEASRESAVCIVSPEWTVEGEGTETAEETEGALVLSRREDYTVSLNAEEIGTLTFVSELAISE